jgi:flagellin
MRINTNIAALNSYNQLKNTQNNLSKSLSRLSSGKRINGAADDAAGLAISEKMGAQIRGLAMAQRNAQDGISMIQTAEGSLKETHSILQRMRELAVQSSNDTNTSVDRAEIQKEINELTSEITRIGNNTEFNSKKIINGDMSGAGTGATQEKQTLDLSSGFAAGTAHDDVKLTVGGESYTIAFDESSNAGAAGMNVDSATKTVTVGILDSVAQIGTDLEAVLNNLKGSDPDLALNEFNISSTSTSLSIEAKETGDFAGADGSDSISLDAGLLAESLSEDANGADGTGGEANFQVGANNGQQFAASISDMRALSNLKISGINSGGSHSVVVGASFTSTGLTDVSDSGTPEYALDVTDAEKATNAIEVINNAIESVSAERSKLGAYQNRLDHTINNLSAAEENLTAAESRISDVDMAKEMMSFTKNQILSQAGTAMLAQANQLPQGVLQLLG